MGEGHPGHLYHHPFLVTHTATSTAASGATTTKKHKAEVEGDTFGSQESFVAASMGFAGTLQAVDQVLQGEVRNAFVACRPPGHHAGRNGKPALDPGASAKAKDVGWGFCFFNYVGGAAIHAVEKWGLSRVTVVDVDLHHGNGTEVGGCLGWWVDWLMGMLSSLLLLPLLLPLLSTHPPNSKPRKSSPPTVPPPSNSSPCTPPTSSLTPAPLPPAAGLFLSTSPLTPLSPRPSTARSGAKSTRPWTPLGPNSSCSGTFHPLTHPPTHPPAHSFIHECLSTDPFIFLLSPPPTHPPTTTKTQRRVRRARERPDRKQGLCGWGKAQHCPYWPLEQ